MSNAAPQGFERWSGGAAIARHRHRTAYAAIVLAGGYEECGSAGRLAARPGHVLLHGAFDSHLDRFHNSGAEIFCLSLPCVMDPPAAIAQLRDADLIIRIAERDPRAAARVLFEQATPVAQTIADWPDALAKDVAASPDICLGAWAVRNGLAAETVSRGFAKLFGISPKAYRAELRARRAFFAIAGGTQGLADIAAAGGFADQAHMTRAVRALTGAAPLHWRMSNRFKTPPH